MAIVRAEARPFFGDDQSDRPTSAPPYIDLKEHTGKRTECGNVAFDDQGRLYICSGTDDETASKLAGVIYRVSPPM